MFVLSRGAIGDHGEDVAQVDGEGFQVGVGQAVRLLLFQSLSVVVNVNDPVFHLQLVVQVLRDSLQRVRVLTLVRERPDVCESGQ